jgi:hypothetical protein
MANNTTAAKPKVGGAIYVAPAGTTLPTGASTTLSDEFEKLGYISEDGLSNNQTINSTTVKAWGGDTVLVIYSGREDSLGYTLIEAMSVEVLKHVFGDNNVSGTLATGITIKVNSDEMPEKVIVVDMVLKDGVLKRIVVPCARVTAVGEIKYSDSSAVGYATTTTAFSDADGNTHYEYLQSKANG